MKVLTILSTIALPSVATSSIFGMNFEFLPWIHEPHGVWYAAAMSLSVTAILIGVLRWRRWI
jgi:magnesium transporter